MKIRSGNYERDARSGLLVPRGCRDTQLRGPSFYAGTVAGGATDPLYSQVVSLLYNNVAPLVDQKGNAPTLQGNATVTAGPGGFFSPAVQLDGTDDWIENSATLLQTGASDFCIEAWIWPTSYGGAAWTTIASNSGASGQRGISFLFNSSTVDLTYFTNGSTAFRNISVSNVIALNAKTHIAGVREGNALRLYKGGVDIGGTLSGTAGTVWATTPNMRWGCVPDGNSYDFTGFFGPCRITVGNCRYTSNFTPDENFPNA